jgi:hypothetical protein
MTSSENTGIYLKTAATQPEHLQATVWAGGGILSLLNTFGRFTNTMELAHWLHAQVVLSVDIDPNVTPGLTKSGTLTAQVV